MSERIWIVAGTTGEYSDRSDWAVCAYRSEEAANRHVSKAQLRAKELEKAGWRSVYPFSEREVNEYDHKMSMDYTGTEYFTYSVELRPDPDPAPSRSEAV